MTRRERAMLESIRGQAETWAGLAAGPARMPRWETTGVLEGLAGQIGLLLDPPPRRSRQH